MKKCLSLKAFLGLCLFIALSAQAQTFPAFTDVTSSLGVPSRTDLFRGNAIWGDFDNDGYPEAIIFSTDGSWGYRALYLENVVGTLSCGSFTDLGLPAFNNDRWDWTSA